METKIIDYSANSFAVVGDTKPIKSELKKLGGKFNFRLSCGAGWIFSNKQREKVEQFLAKGEMPTSTKNEPKTATSDDKKLLNEYLAEYTKVGCKDLDYYSSKFSSAIRLENGGILVFEKPRIQTNFCFGYHLSQYDTKDFDDANKMADYASKNEDYFLTRNLEDFDRTIEEIETGKRDGFQTVILCIHRVSFRNEILNVWNYNVFTHHSYDENKKYGEQRGAEYQVANDTDKAAILEALKHERNKFEKRLKTYLKRYGTSKLRTWSYWRDA